MTFQFSGTTISPPPKTAFTSIMAWFSFMLAFVRSTLNPPNTATTCPPSKSGELMRRSPPPNTATSFRWEVPDERSEEHTSELQSQSNLVCRLLLEKKKQSERFS